MIIIKCGTCKKEKSEDEYAVYHGKRGKSCKQCRKYYNDLWETNKGDYKEKRKKYYRENKERFRFRSFKGHVLRNYDISFEFYQKMFKDQSGRCAICGILFELVRTKPNQNKIACVDHDHQTNKVRGLLCRMCNIALGYLESGVIDKAREYLRVHEMKDKEPS